MRPPLPRLHAITDEQIARRQDLDGIVNALAGAHLELALHARGRSLSGREHYDLATLLSAQPPVRMFVNDRLDVALATNAAGVQLRQDSLPPSTARALRRDWWIGRSVHSLDEARSALDQGADYLVAGPMYATVSHPGLTPLPEDTLHAMARFGAPVIAIGGITADRIPGLKDCGIHGVAVIRAVWESPDPTGAARGLLAALEP